MLVVNLAVSVEVLVDHVTRNEGTPRLESVAAIHRIEAVSLGLVLNEVVHLIYEVLADSVAGFLHPRHCPFDFHHVDDLVPCEARIELDVIAEVPSDTVCPGELDVGSAVDHLTRIDIG